MAAGYTVKQLLPSLIFPAICFGSIYLDWAHTRRWKEQQRAKLALLDRELE